MLHYEKRLSSYREKGQRKAQWRAMEEALEKVEEPELITLLRDLDLEAMALTRRKIKGKSEKKK